MLKIVSKFDFKKILKAPFVLHLLVLLLISFFMIGASYSKNYRTFKVMPRVLGEAVVIKTDLAATLGVQNTIKADANKVKKVVVLASSPSPSPKVLVSAPSDATRSELCKGITEPWKMIPDPAHEGVYVICNTVSEKMTTVDDLNTAQNNYRKEHGLSTLNINSKICEIAAKRAVEVTKNFSHSGFESAVEGSGLGKTSYGENIASGPLSGVHFVEWSWDKSPGHKANMLGDWTDGCGGVNDKYAVFLFAK